MADTRGDGSNPFKGMMKMMGNVLGKTQSNTAGSSHSQKNILETIPASVSDTFREIGAGIMNDAQNTHKPNAQHHHSSAHAPEHASAHSSAHSSHHSEHSSGHHNEHNHSSLNYQLSPYFEKAVELINAAAGIIVMASVVLAGVNLILVAVNANFGKRNIHSFLYKYL